MAPGWTIAYNVFGKVNEAITIGDAIAMHWPIHVVNYDSAGALLSCLAGFPRVTHFLQGDMDVRALEFEFGQRSLKIIVKFLSVLAGYAVALAINLAARRPN
jgi:nucleoside phosphorylase